MKIIYFSLLCLLMSCRTVGPQHSDVAAIRLDNHSKDLKIAIVGAGAAGLVAANTLKNQGYKDITIFEKEKDAGGKIETATVGAQNFDMGAYWISEDYRQVLDLAAELGVKVDAWDVPKTIVAEDGQEYSFTQYYLKKYGPIKGATSLMNFEKTVKKYRSLYFWGYADTHPDLFENFQTFVDKNKFSSLADTFEPFFVACGYGYYEDIPALYFMKLYPWIAKIGVNEILNDTVGMDLASLKHVPGGFQSIFLKLAEKLNVKYNAEVTKINRKMVDGKWQIDVTTAQGTQTFDRIIVSPDLDSMLWVLDATPEEKDLFSRIRYKDYYVTLFTAEGLFHNRGIFYRKNIKKGTEGGVMAVANVGDNSNVYSVWQLAADPMTPNDLIEYLKKDVKDWGGVFGKVVEQKRWKYFPHVKTEDLKAGFYPRLRALQGAKGTYYVGGIFNFETVEHTTLFARSLMEKHFDGDNTLVVDSFSKDMRAPLLYKEGRLTLQNRSSNELAAGLQMKVESMDSRVKIEKEWVTLPGIKAGEKKEITFKLKSLRPAFYPYHEMRITVQDKAGQLLLKRNYSVPLEMWARKSAYSLCTERDGLGYGEIFDCDGARCAKAGQDLKNNCMISPNTFDPSEVLPICEDNQGQGWGKTFACNGSVCAKTSETMQQDCLVSPLNQTL